MSKTSLSGFLLIFFSVLNLHSQQIPPSTTAEERLQGYEVKKSLSDDHILRNLVFHSVGPTIMGGRVTDIDVSPYNENEFFIAYASGGLFHTVNNGQSYRPLFDNEMVISIGDIAVDWKNNVIWIGSGENNSSRSSYSGFGIYRSDDMGKTWKNMGLHDSHHIGRLLIHPSDPDIIYAAVMGHLYSPNTDRGVFKSTDGGDSWKKVLYIDEQTGAIDLVLNPANSDEVYAAMWQRSRKAWNFEEGGINSGIYRSSDGGENWENLTAGGSGFPEGNGKGRIGLAISGDGSSVFAMIDNQNPRPEEKEKEEGLTKDQLREMSKDDFLKLDKKELDKYLRKFGYPEEFKADSMQKLVRKDKIKVSHLVDYLEDANASLFETKVVGAEVYRMDKNSAKWLRTHEKYLDDLVYTYGYYFGQIRVSALDKNKIYIAGVPILRSEDGGKTFKSINGDNQHVDHHAIWLSSSTKGHIINGNDGGINISYDDGENWLKVKSPPVGQFYTVNADMEKPYNIYGGLQDNGVWFGPSTYKEGSAWEGQGKYPYKNIMGGDGFKVQIDTRDNKTIYTGYQFGHYYRFKREGGKRTKITPKHKLGERPLRFNWQTPVYLSRHNQDILYFGSNKFHRSLNQGDSYDLVSRDLTGGGKKGDVAFGTITTIHESPLKFGLIYLGTDDGFVYRSDDIGYTWENLASDLPTDMWVTAVEASAHDTGRVYVALNGYRWDHFSSYIYESGDFGKTWNRIGLSLPAEPVNAIKEDPVNENFLYVGTDGGLYISINRGINFNFISNGFPAVAVHDMVIQPSENDLIVATHGRSIYKANIGHLQKLTDSVMAKGIHLFQIPSKKHNENWGKKYNNWEEIKSPETSMALYVKTGGLYNLEIKTESGLTLYNRIDTLERGMNYQIYNLTLDEAKLKEYVSGLKKENSENEVKKADDGKYYLKPGKYKASWFSFDGKIKSEQNFNIEKNETN